MSHISRKDIVRAAVKQSLAAAVYVLLVITLMSVVSAKRANTPDTPLDIFTGLMLFSVSAGVMASLVFGKPVMWYLDGHKKEAVHLLGWTLGTMALITAAAVVFLA